MDYNEEEISNEIIEWVNYFMLFDVDSINNKIVNKPANNMLNKDKESILIIKDKLFNQTYQLNNPLLNKEFDQNKNKCVNNLLNDYNVEGNQNKNIILNEKNIEININENFPKNELLIDNKTGKVILKSLKKNNNYNIDHLNNEQFLIEIKNKETLNFNNNDTKKNNITNTEKKKEFKNIKLQKFYNLSTDFNNDTDKDIYPKNNKYNYIKSIEKIPLTNPNKIKFTNKSSSVISNNENKNNEINKIYKNFLNIKSNQNIKNPTNENILLQSRNKSQGINSQKNVSNNLRINTFENNKEMNKTQKIKKENNKEMIHNKINSNPNLKTINSKNNIFVEMTLLKDVSYTSLYQWKVLYKKRDPKEYNYENKNDNYKSEFFSFNNEPIDIQKPYRVTKNFKGLAKVKYLDENNILKQFNQEDIDDDKEKIIKKDNSNVYFMRKNKRNKNKNEKISNNKKYNIHKDFINRVENFQSIN
jgi:hypothetical protein